MSYGLRVTPYYVSSEAPPTPPGTLPSFTGPLHDAAVDRPFLTLNGDAFLARYATGLFYIAPVALDRKFGAPVEWTRDVNRKYGVPVEWGRALVRDIGVPVEWQGFTQVTRTFGIPVEWFATLARLYGVPVEWLATRVRNYGVPAEWLSGLARRYGVPVDWFTPTGALTRRFGSPVEWGGQPADSLLVTWDVRVPLDAPLLVTWTIVSGALVAQLPVVWTVRSPSTPLTVMWTVLPAELVSLFLGTGTPSGYLSPDIQRPYGRVEETP